VCVACEGEFNSIIGSLDPPFFDGINRHIFEKKDNGGRDGLGGRSEEEKSGGDNGSKMVQFGLFG